MEQEEAHIKFWRIPISEPKCPETGVRATDPWKSGERLFPAHERSQMDSVAAYFNSYFASCRERNKASGITNDGLLNQLSETAFTALHTRSGWYGAEDRSQRNRLERTLRGETLLILSLGEQAQLFLVRCNDNLGRGGSGYVVRCCIDGEELVMKRWQRYEMDLHIADYGLEHLRNETAIYGYLHKHHPEALGRILPRPIAICVEEDDEFPNDTLIMTCVGEEVTIEEVENEEDGSSSERWIVNGEVLGEDDVGAIKKKPKENAEELEELGLVDNDNLIHNAIYDNVWVRSLLATTKWNQRSTTV